MDRIGPAMQRFIDKGKIVGIGTLAVRQGDVIHSGWYGMLDKEANKPLRPDSILRIYSLTKPITAVALLMLMEEGSLKLEEPISAYFPSFRQMKVFSVNQAGESTYEEVEQEITIRHLLTHTSGLAYGAGIDDSPVEQVYGEAGFFSDIVTLQVPLETMIHILADLPLATQPGTAWRYSIAYDVIGHLIQIITDQSLDVFLRERIFEPLEMVDTGFVVPADKRERFGPLYSSPEEGEISAVDRGDDGPFLDPGTALSGGAGLVSTMSDYSRFLAMLTNEGEWGDTHLLKRDSVKRMTSNQLADRQFPVRFEDPWPGLGYGLGVGVQMDHLPNEGWPVGTFGWLGLSGTWAWTFPKESVSVIAMPQAWAYWDPGAVFQKLVYEEIGS